MRASTSCETSCYLYKTECKMLYPKDIEVKIGFDKIRDQLSMACRSDLAREEMALVAFGSDFDQIDTTLTHVEQMVHLLDEGGGMPVGTVVDLRTAFVRTRAIGSHLEADEVAAVRSNILLAQQTRDALCRSEGRFDRLRGLCADLEFPPGICAAIDRLLDKYGQVNDGASAELLRIRRAMAQAEGSVSRTLQTVLRQAQADGWIEADAQPTLRDGRLVIPIAAMNKRRVAGIVHDESATGKTVYIEPTAVVEANNRLREIQSEERREILRLLVEITDFLRPCYDTFLEIANFLARVDALQAKAEVARIMHAVRPQLQRDPLIDWHQARHPLLQRVLAEQQRRIVPLDISLDSEQRLLLISGPNAGGKSVCLKTVGLLQYMLQCGLLIPVGEQSRAGLFASVFVDIGDEQSIENDLSTYSSHLLNMKFCLRNSDERTLLLIDEFGTGTEPMIGGAIAEAVLERLNMQGAWGVITTHYANLKHFAAETAAIVNGAMLFDRNHMQPLFCLQIGTPGSSFAIEMARAIGLPEDVIALAASKIGADHLNYDKNIQDAARDKRYWERKRAKIRDAEKHIEALQVQYEEALKHIKEEQRRMLAQAQEEAAELIRKANARIEYTIRIIREKQAEAAATREVREQLQKFRQQNMPSKTSTPLDKSVDPSSKLVEGAYVRLKGRDMIGQLIQLNRKSAVVAFGDVKSIVSIDQLEVASHAQARRQQRDYRRAGNVRDTIRTHQLNIKTEIDVRGMRVEEALSAVLAYIDEASMVGLGTVRILHGTGTGALRQAIREYLSTVDVVTDFQDEHVQLGGAGITVVKLR